jgi:hypothetical protein
MVKPEAKTLSWQCLLIKISFILDHESFLMLIRTFPSFWLELALIISLLGDYGAKWAKMVLAVKIVSK